MSLLVGSDPDLRAPCRTELLASPRHLVWNNMLRPVCAGMKNMGCHNLPSTPPSYVNALLQLLVLIAPLDIIGEVDGRDCLIIALDGPPLPLSLWFLYQMSLLHLRSNWQLQWWCFYASIRRVKGENSVYQRACALCKFIVDASIR